MKRISRWSKEKQDAGLTEFRRLLGNHRKEEVQNAMKAGRSLRRMLEDARIVITGVDDVQLERFRRRYAVPLSLKGVMFAVATSRRYEPEKVVVKTQEGIPLTVETTTCLWAKRWGVESPEAQKLMKR